MELKNKYKELKEKIEPYQIVMMGDFLMYVEGKITLMTLNEECIVFKVKEGVIVVAGKELKIKDITENSLTILGKIISWEKV